MEGRKEMRHRQKEGRRDIEGGEKEIRRLGHVSEQMNIGEKNNLLYSALRDCYMLKTLYMCYLISKQSSKVNIALPIFFNKDNEVGEGIYIRLNRK